MKCSELISILERYKYFNVELVFNDHLLKNTSPRTLSISDINEIGFKDKVVILNTIEK